ncbi:hypothetical protein PAPYR_7906 [Paratrimastix pyriformis]|uniref:Uncharacterized protein n=1 Tax=Paratrimastix pyriformis TaxID=342808 RepID=A0ABQ8UBW2_9EUKA|nr:hypothetical protein PAPYR_7906 [Paratrimastix pyriformis]
MSGVELPATNGTDRWVNGSLWRSLRLSVFSLAERFITEGNEPRGILDLAESVLGDILRRAESLLAGWLGRGTCVFRSVWNTCFRPLCDEPPTEATEPASELPGPELVCFPATANERVPGSCHEPNGMPSLDHACGELLCGLFEVVEVVANCHVSHQLACEYSPGLVLWNV